MAAGLTLIEGASELVIGPADGPHPGRDGPPADREAVLEIVRDGALAIDGGEVVAVGTTAEVRAVADDVTTRIDATGKTVLPGFVDAHTHAAFAGDRSDEFAAKLRGRSYQEILAAGGGILRTVRAVRSASDAELVDRLTTHLDAMLAQGTTTVEIKSGYGLDVDTECRLLAAIDAAGADHPVRVVPTFLGAHAVPEDMDAATYVDAVIDDQLPAVADQGIATFCDVFCEKGVFDVAQSRRMLEAGREVGLTPKVHADEFVRLGGAALAAELGATSADHLLRSNADDAAALAAAEVTPVLLPATAFALDTAFADPRPFLAAGGEPAVATDFNPNCYAPGMPFTITLACAGMRLTPAEAIRAATVGGRGALETDDDRPPAVPPDLGTLRAGAPADAIVIDAPSLDHVAYRFGENRVETVLIEGAIVHERDPAG